MKQVDRFRKVLQITLPASRGSGILAAYVLLAAERIGCRPEESYVFEDSENGIRAGKAAGMRAIMIPDLIAPTEEMRKLSDGIYADLRMAMYAIF